MNRKKHPYKPSSPNVTLSRFRFQAGLGTAVVAGLFIGIVCFLLVRNYSLSRIADPLEPAELTKLKKQLQLQPDNNILKNRIRTFDKNLRQRFMFHRKFSHTGGHLLLLGLILFFIGARTASTFAKEKLTLHPPAAVETQRKDNHLAFWLVVGLGLVIAGSAVALIAGRPIKINFADISAPDPSLDEFEKYWPRFRGPYGLGISATHDVPVTWDTATGKNIIWKTEIPLPGHNSPVVWQDQVFLTGADKKSCNIFCFHAGTGELLWQRELKPPIPSDNPESLDVMEDTGSAASSAATDGKRIFAIFANGYVAGFDFQGKQLWFKNLGIPLSNYGYASSLALYRNLLLIKYDQEFNDQDKPQSKMLALDTRSGNIVWQMPRPVPGSWTSPIVVETKKGPQLITCGIPWVIAYNPATGEEIWRAECLNGDIAPSPVYARGIVYVISPSSEVFAIRTDGRGDVTKTHILWIAEDGIPDICSPVTNGKLLFLLTTDGLLTCYSVPDGKKLWEEELDEDFQSSPTWVADKLYLLSDKGTMIIVNADSRFHKIGTAELREKSTCSPAFVEGRIYIRGKKHLFCIGKKPDH